MFDNMFGGKSVAQGAVIAIEPLSETIHFCTATGDQRAMKTSSANYKPRAFDQEFYDRLTKIVKQQREKKPKMDLQKAAVILPDQLFLLDMVSVPMIHRKAMQHSLSLAIESVYKNAEDLSLVTYAVQQNKQVATFGLAGARRDLLDQVRQTFADSGVAVTGITFASNAMVNGAFALNPKLKGDTFLLLDIKENYSRFAFVVRGCTMGYYDLPFGYEMLYKSRLAEEDMLFDHRAGELLVLNAKERARAKQLTMEGEIPSGQTGEETTTSQGRDGTLRKVPRKLPKFMQRPVPQSQDDYLYENFRIFIKWALDLIGNNRDIVSLDKLDTVYVNMPAEYNFLFDVVNKRRESHGVTFAPLLSNGIEMTTAKNLELYGGFFLGQYNEANTF
jgi:hypothetical protein